MLNRQDLGPRCVGLELSLFIELHQLHSESLLRPTYPVDIV